MQSCPITSYYLQSIIYLLELSLGIGAGPTDLMKTTVASNHDGLVIRDKSGTAIDEESVATNHISVQRRVTEMPDSNAGDGESWNRLRPAIAYGYLRMGWQSTRCLWRQYRMAGTEQESLFARERLGQFAWFWMMVIGVSMAFLWSTFGFFHELFCCCVNVPPDVYAKDVNQYLTMVPPQVVVTNKGKMFWYQPSSEERFLWKSAKKIANFKM